MVRNGLARPGVAVEVWRGLARPGASGRGVVWHGEAAEVSRGLARPGASRRGVVWQSGLGQVALGLERHGRKAHHVAAVNDTFPAGVSAATWFDVGIGRADSHRASVTVPAIRPHGTRGPFPGIIAVPSGPCGKPCGQTRKASAGGRPQYKDKSPRCPSSAATSLETARQPEMEART